MTDVNSDEYWASQFDLTQDDLRRLVERMEREGIPQDMKNMALRIVRGRLEHGHDISPAVLSDLTGKSSVRLWDPAVAWKPGDIVLVARQAGVDSRGKPIYGAYLGEVVEIENDLATIIIENSGAKKFSLAVPGSKNAIAWYETVHEVVESKLQSDDLTQQAEGILFKYGDHIFSRLEATLQSDSRFSGFESRWYIKEKLPDLKSDDLKSVHRALLQRSASVNEILPIIKNNTGPDEILLRMAIQITLQQSPDQFENIGTSARPQWKARLPQPNQAAALYYAYDPQTYEILCRTGQRLNQKNAQRLQDLNIYNEIVTFAE